MSTKNEELSALRKKVSELESNQSNKNSNTDPGRTFFSELEAIKRKGKNSSGEIKYKEIDDHKNIPLWRKDGKMIGPIHPANAERTFKDFFNLGILLSVTKPTEKEIEEYKKTDEYIKWKEKQDKLNEQNRKSLKGNAIEKMTEQIAKIVGVKTSEVNKLKRPEEVGV